MGILDPAKLLVILVLALIVIGPERLPATARRLGAAWRTMSHYREQAEHGIRDAVDSLNLPNVPTIRPRQMLSDLFTEDVVATSRDSERRLTGRGENTPLNLSDIDHSIVSDRLAGRCEEGAERDIIGADLHDAKTIVAASDVSMN